MRTQVVSSKRGLLYEYLTYTKGKRRETKKEKHIVRVAMVFSFSLFCPATKFPAAMPRVWCYV